MKRIRISIPVAAAVVSGVIMMVALMIHPLVGVADNGDFNRSINGQGIYKLDRYQDDQHYQYFSSKYGVYEYFNESGKSLLSVQNMYIKAAKFLDELCTSDKNIFDIRFLSVILVLQMVGGIYLLVDYMTWKKPLAQKLLLSAIGIFMFADTAYTAYFNSFYAEGIVYVTFFWLTVCALLLTQKRYSPYLLLFLIAVNGLLLIFTKQQNATAGAVLLFLFLFIACGFGINQGAFRKIAVAGAVLMGTAGVVMYVSIPEQYVVINQYHAMTRGALMTGENPETTLDEFGIDKQYSILDGTIYFERYPSADPESEQLKKEFYSNYGFVSLTVYYLTHLDELMVILNKAANNGYMIRPEALGNYERIAGKSPGEKTEFFTIYSNWKKSYIPNTVGFVAIWMIVVSGCTFQDKRKFMVMICTILMGLIQVGTSIIGAGDADLSKHIFLYNVCFDLVSYVCFAPLLTNFIIFIVKNVSRLVVKRKKVLLLFLLPVFLMGMKGNAYAEREKESRKVAILCQQGEDVKRLENLAEACGMSSVVVREPGLYKNSLENVSYVITTTELPLQDVREKGIPTLCLGKAAMQIPGIKLSEYHNRTTQIFYEEYVETERFEERMTVIDSGAEKSIGAIWLSEDLEVPFAVQAEDHNYYVPYYRTDGISTVILGEIIMRMAGTAEDGNMYFVLDEVYPFSDLNKLCRWADLLYAEGIPFLVRIMPVYDNLDYPAFTRYTQVLSYLQYKGGTIVLHEPFIVDVQLEVEPLADKMERFQDALKAENIYYRDMDKVPYPFSYEDLSDIKAEGKNFGNFGFSSAICINSVEEEENLQELVSQINRKWLSFSDYEKEFTDDIYLYAEKEIPDDFEYREKEEAKFTLFFSASDRFLLAVVGISLVIFLFFLWIGRKWYRRKFYIREEKRK